MSDLIVTATWDPEANVWVAESEQLPIITEAPTLDALVAKLPGIIQDLLDDDDNADDSVVSGELMRRLREQARGAREHHVPFELVARVNESAHRSIIIGLRRLT